jgi:hypothetical protein
VVAPKGVEAAVSDDLPPIGIIDLLQLGSCNPDDLPETLAELQTLRAEAERLAPLLLDIRSQIDKEIRRHLGPGGAMAWGGRRFISRDAREWEWTDADGLVEELGADLGRCINGRYVRKTDAVQVIRYRARKRHESEDAAEAAFLKRYGRYKDTGRLEVKPAEKAPKRLQELEHGQAIIVTTQETLSE